MLSQQELHERMLYPVTRIRALKAGGSGVLVSSREDPKEKGKYINIVLTCHHVIAEAIEIKEDWDSVLKRSVKKDFIQEVTVQTFDYDGSRLLSANGTPGEIIAYDQHHDLAAIKLMNPRKMENVAKVIPANKIQDMKLFDSCWVSGCSLLHDPFASEGRITYLREMMDQKAYIMHNAPAIFGNSGGACFHGDTGDLLGLVSRVTAIELGFGIDVMTWMSFSTHPSRMYEFFNHHELQFIYDEADDFYAAKERREKKKKDALRNLFLGDEKKEGGK